MEIKTISFGLTRNLGNYQSARLDMSVEIKEGEDWDNELRQLKILVAEQIGMESDDLVSLSDLDSELKAELSNILGKIADKKQELAKLKREACSLDREIQKLRNFNDLVLSESNSLKHNYNHVFKTWGEIKQSEEAEKNLKILDGGFPEHEYPPVDYDGEYEDADVIGDLSGNLNYADGRDSDRQFAQNAGLKYLDVNEFIALK